MIINEKLIGKNMEGSDYGINIRYYPGICLKRHRKTKRNLSQEKQSLGSDLNLEPTKY
jgi:hypothetical protein